VIRFAACLLGLAAFAAEPAPPSPESREDILDRGASLGFIPLASPAAGHDLGLYLEGFFRDDAGKVPAAIPAKARRLADHLTEYRAAGATHLVFVYQEDEAEAEHLRLLLLGDFGEDAQRRLEGAGLGRRGAAGSFELLACKDGEEAVGAASWPPLPIARLAALAEKVAPASSGSVDFIDLRRKDAPEACLEALREAFAEDGQPPEKADVPPRARQLVEAIPFLRTQGARQLVVTAHQNAKGADVVLVVAQGAFAPDVQVRLRAMFASHGTEDGVVVLRRWVDGEEKGAGPPVAEPRRNPPKK
jgi:hypothetical protein